MGVFQHMIPVFNVGRVPCVVTFDGQQTTVPVGPSQLPDITLPYAKNQNPVMGSQDPNNPSLTGVKTLIRVVDKDDCTPMTDEEWEAHSVAACRMDWLSLIEDRLKPGERVVVKGKKAGVQAKSAFDTGVRSQPLGLGTTDRTE
jgi:hypothetical protein